MYSDHVTIAPFILLVVLSYLMAYMFYKKYKKSQNTTPADETLLESGGQQKGNIVFLSLAVLNVIVSIVGTPLLFTLVE
eukprot:CAMPEP_0185905866 /NCGR_PEP_ID=MMETSP0196C-20130402/5002_1 /TAXON_ID=2932 /ORGANISM="Alexandrium fundyense, Strain CCMP1719" /LENGTH=78 /DNA_ID=CAMNT_0028625487 /DNA_START=175 /DNA_END=411 /DNA_ORIENTATION=+